MSRTGQGKRPQAGVPPSQDELEKGGGSKAGGGREATQDITNPVACADGGRGGDISKKAYSRREGPHKEFLKKG